MNRTRPIFSLKAKQLRERANKLVTIGLCERGSGGDLVLTDKGRDAFRDVAPDVLAKFLARTGKR